MSGGPTDLLYPIGIIGCIHQIVAVSNLPALQLNQGNRGLTVVQGSRSHQGTYRQANIVCIQMQLIPVPWHLIALGALLVPSAVLPNIDLNGEINFFGLAPSTMISCLWASRHSPWLGFAGYKTIPGNSVKFNYIITLNRYTLLFVIKRLFAKGSAVLLDAW